MDQRLGVGRRQPLGNLPADAQHLRHRQPALALQARVQRFPLQQGHGQEEDTPVLAHLVDGDDVVVRQRRRCPGFPQKTLAAGGVGQAGLDGLQGHQPAQQDILGTKDDAHAACAQHAEDAIRAEPAHLVGTLGWGEEVLDLPVCCRVTRRRSRAGERFGRRRRQGSEPLDELLDLVPLGRHRDPGLGLDGPDQGILAGQRLHHLDARTTAPEVFFQGRRLDLGSLAEQVLLPHLRGGTRGVRGHAFLRHQLAGTVQSRSPASSCRSRRSTRDLAT
jgi:hypothetical protein